MANTQVGIYNYNHCIQSHIPSLGSQKIIDALTQRLDDSHYRNRLSGKFDDVLVINALSSLLKWHNSARTFGSFTATEQRCIWNAYCMAMWDITALKHCNIDRKAIKYHLAEAYEADVDVWEQHEQIAMTDSWCDGTSGESTIERSRVYW